MTMADFIGPYREHALKGVLMIETAPLSWIFIDFMASIFSQLNKMAGENWKVKLDRRLHEKNMFTEALEKLEQKTKIDRLYLVLAGGVLLAVYLVFGYGSAFLCSFLGFLYPAYCSLKAIESADQQDDTKWLMYWIVYSAFSMVEFFTDIILCWIPFYNFLKCAFLIYCMAPTSWNGSIFIYNNIIRPFVLKHEKEIDQMVNRVTDMASEAQGLASDVMDEAGKLAQGVAAQAMQDAATEGAENVAKRVVPDSSKTD